MAKRTVVWTRTADIQFVGILEYWVKRNKSNSYSKKLLGLVAEKTKQIAETPFIYKSTDLKTLGSHQWETLAFFIKSRMNK